MFLALGACFTSCSDDDDSDDPANNRVIVNVDFESADNIIAGPTSYGANLYYGYDGKQYTEAEFPVTATTKLHIGLNVNVYSGEIDFLGGGMALSNWNLRTSPTDMNDVSVLNWWYTYENQCSVYNVNSLDGSNNGAGAGGSNTFVVSNGYKNDVFDTNTCGRMNFTGGAEYEVRSIELCNSSYVYGTLMHGNPYGNDPEKSIEEVGGWFSVKFYGYDAQGNPTNGGQPVVYYLCDYRADSPTRSAAIDKWHTCDLSALGKVNAIEVDFDGSDCGAYGLNTPAYVCLDNVKVDVTPER